MAFLFSGSITHLAKSIIFVVSVLVAQVRNSQLKQATYISGIIIIRIRIIITPI